MTDLPDLIEASAKLARITGEDDPDMRAARKHARRALALAIGTPEQLVERLDQTTTEKARQKARQAVAATRTYRPDSQTTATRGAADALRDAIRAALERVDARRT
ncbi:hypothetical protein [Thalassovita taeanensis]|uniref:Uncharacterized protein n=1 Tax=Thalassovita taeanensis TaxID=657014 RepID=A0A1H9FAY9_9RHOB|nr:hypothetical protein [Thalassovita taeanensis]SEQ35092.1 hypothetical protein SAMN04488092_10617 [Thalassovita taeanensis]